MCTEPWIWNEENLLAYRRRLAEDRAYREKRLPGQSRKLFYVEPRGSLMQCEMTVALAVNYRLRNVSDEMFVRTLLGYGKPLFWVDCMSEREPCSGEFYPVRYDLMAMLLDRRDKALLKRLCQETDLSDLPEYAQIQAIVHEF